MGVCTAFVFAALVEFTFVNYLWRKTSMAGPRYALRGGSREAENAPTASTNGHHPQGEGSDAPGAGTTSQEIVEMNLVSQ